MVNTIQSLLAEATGLSPDGCALLGLSGQPLDYRGLAQVVHDATLALHELGIGRLDNVAVVLPNGPRMATCFLSVASAAVCAPLNPAYSASEFRFFLEDLKPTAMIVDSESDSPANSVAANLGIPVLRMTSGRDRPAGWFRLEGPGTGKKLERARPALPDDVALVLHTSGSTSRPKQVPLTHANLCDSANSIRASLVLTPADRCLNIMPLFHIHGLVGALLSSLAAGGSVVCTPGFLAPNFVDWLAEFAPTWYTGVPTMHQAVVNRIRHNRQPGLRFIRSCSAALPPKLMAEMEAALQVPVIEAYGMTEASHQMAINPLPPGNRKPGSVGRAAGCEIAIMAEDGSLLPAASSGHVVIRGSNVTSGYRNNAEANSSSFVNGWFRTGDLGRLDSEGYLFLTGRSKEIINRGGEKIAPREIDEVLMDHPAVAQAMAFALPDSRLGEDVGALVVLREPSEDLAELEVALRGFAGQRLADFKVPSQILFVDEIPKGPTGKPQRIGLAERLGIVESTNGDSSSGAPYTPPSTGIEQRLADIWLQVLRVDVVGVHSEFLSLGGDSILAAQIVVRVRTEFGVEFPVHRLFDAPTVATMAKVIQSLPRIGAAESGPIARIPRDAPLPISFAQQRMWFLAQFEEEGAAYVIPVAFRLKGPLRLDALQRSLDRIVERHEILRTVYLSPEGAPVQVIQPPQPLPLPVIEVKGESEIEDLVRVQVRRPFDLSREIPLRALLMRLEPDDHVLVVLFHHIASDGWSKSIFFDELTDFYQALVNGAQPALRDLQVQYADYAAWLARSLERESSEGLAAYWKQRIAGAPPLLELPTDRPRTGRQTFRGSTERGLLPKDLTGKLRSLGSGENATLFMVLLAAFQTLLSRWSGQTDISIGTPLAHRTRQEVENLIGFFVNVLVMRTDLGGAPTFRELLGRVRETALGAYKHQDFPLERLIDVTSPRRRLSHSPLFQVMFQLRNFPEIAATIQGLNISAIELDPGTAQFDLTLELAETDRGLVCALNYNTGLFDASTARRMLGHYRTILDAVADNPDLRVSTLPMLTETERHQLLVDWNQTAIDYPHICVHRLFEEQVRRSPGAVAAIFEGHSWTYADLNQRADQIATHIKDKGAGPGANVSICVERSLEMLAALLGIWKSGAAYVPLDPAYPRERLQFILDDAGPAVLITEKRLRDAVPASTVPVMFLDDWQPPERSSPAAILPEPAVDSVAYILYTSGSTGKPKGVAICHGSLSNLLDSIRREIEPVPSDRLLALATISFDISALELFLPLITGGCVVIARKETAGDGQQLSKAIEKLGATIVQATPATWQLLIETGWTSNRGLKIISGGEAFPPAHAGPLLRNGTVWNAYGPTETTIYSLIARVRAYEAALPIGKPLGNTRVYVVDREQQLVPIGVPGELYIGGDGLAAGYWKQAGLTSEKFIRDPFSTDPESRIYKTGDLVRYLPDGNIEFLRRIDTQVKIRGFRIELGEIESVLCEHPGVRTAAAAVFGDAAGDKRLVAYFVARQDPPPAEADLRDFLKRKLPGYMAPSAFVSLAELPLTPNGKLDRKALAAPTPTLLRVPDELNRDMLETTLAHIWEDVLNRRPIGLRDDFFDLGGHSLLAVRLLARVEKAFGQKLGLVHFFEAPTVAQMAHLLRGLKARLTPSKVVPIRSSGSRLPIFFLGPYPLLRPLILCMPDDQPVFGISMVDPSAMAVPFRLEDIAARQIDALREFQSHGPYVLAGWCSEGVLAYEMAHQLTAQGEWVSLVVLFDSFNPWWQKHRGAWANRADRVKFHVNNLARMDGAAAAAYCRDRWRTLTTKIKRIGWRAAYKLRMRADRRGNHQLRNAVEILNLTVSEYVPTRYSGRVALVRPQLRPAGARSDAALGWTSLIPQLEVVDVPGNHTDMFREPHVESMAGSLDAALLACAAPDAGHANSLDESTMSNSGGAADEAMAIP